MISKPDSVECDPLCDGNGVELQVFEFDFFLPLPAVPETTCFSASPRASPLRVSFYETNPSNILLAVLRSSMTYVYMAHQNSTN